MSKGNVFASPAIAEEMKKVYGREVESLEIDTQYDAEITEFVRMIDEAHKKTADSKLVFH
jgi:hypothetical protein